jgi:hypothetical protein
MCLTRWSRYEYRKVRWVVVATRTSLHDPGCTFCPDNGKIKILQTSPSGNTVFVQTMVKEGGVFVPATGAYFVIPVGHYAPSAELPFDFWNEINWHIRESGMVFDNDNVNRTREGGAVIVEHLHYWLIQVQPGDKPMGLYTLRKKVRSWRAALQDFLTAA